MSQMSATDGRPTWALCPESCGASPTGSYFVGVIDDQAANCACASPPLNTAAPAPPLSMRHRPGELEALRAALGRVELALEEERARAGAIQRGVRRAAEDRAAAAAAQAETLGQKIEWVKILRKELRQDLSVASEQLRAAAQRNADLTSALAAAQREGEVARAERNGKDAELARAREHAVSLQIKLQESREQLDAVTISRDAKDAVIDRLQNQLAAARAHAAAQTAAAATTAAAHRHLQHRVQELQGQGNRSVAAWAAENEDLRRKLKGLRAELAAARTDASVETVRACSSTARLASEKQELCERLHVAQREAAAQEARVVRLQGQAMALRKECQAAREEAAAARGAAVQACRAMELLQARFGQDGRESEWEAVALGAVIKGLEEMGRQLGVVGAAARGPHAAVGRERAGPRHGGHAGVAA